MKDFIYIYSSIEWENIPTVAEWIDLIKQRDCALRGSCDTLIILYEDLRTVTSHLNNQINNMTQTQYYYTRRPHIALLVLPHTTATFKFHTFAINKILSSHINLV